MSTNPHIRSACLSLALAAAAALTLTACRGADETEGDAETTTEATAADRLEEAHTVLAEAASVHVTLEGIDLPASAIILSAEGSGTMEPAAFDGTITANVSGVQADVPTIAVDDTLY